MFFMQNLIILLIVQSIWLLQGYIQIAADGSNDFIRAFYPQVLLLLLYAMGLKLTHYY